jgi:hypothetical protein
VPLTVIDSPYREITKPVLEYVRSIRRESPRELVTVFIPEYVVGRWWENLLHNQSALRLKTRLLYQPGVMVTNVPWQLESTDRLTSPEHIGRVRQRDARQQAIRAAYRGAAAAGRDAEQVRVDASGDEADADPPR